MDIAVAWAFADATGCPSRLVWCHSAHGYDRQCRTYLQRSLVEGLSEDFKVSLVAAAASGDGLSVIVALFFQLIRQSFSNMRMG